MEYPFWLIQGLGGLAALVNCTCFLLKRRDRIVGGQMLSAILWALHFGLLGAQTAVVMNALGFARQGVFALREHAKWAQSSRWLVFFCLAFTIGGLLSWESWVSLLPILGMLIGTIGMWVINTKHLRLINMIPPPLWFLHNYLHFSIGGMLSDSIIFFSLIAGYLIHETTLFSRLKS
ncbi:MAG: YgjV family protein [Chthoniobacterales bacterium]